MGARTLNMPAKDRHDLTETLRYLRALAAGKAAAFRPYVHVKGRLYSTMKADAAEDARLELVALAAKSGEALRACPADVAKEVAKSRLFAPVIEGWRAVRPSGSLTLAAPLAQVIPLPVAAPAVDVVCMGCLFDGFKHECGGALRAS